MSLDIAEGHLVLMNLEILEYNFHESHFLSCVFKVSKTHVIQCCCNEAIDVAVSSGPPHTNK